MEFRVPELGEGIYEAELVEWLVQPGEYVAHGQPLMEVMTDKAVTSVPSPFEGQIRELRAIAGEQIQVGETILDYDPTTPGGMEGGTTSHVEHDHVAETDTATEKVRDGLSGVTPDSTARVRAAPSVRRQARRLGLDLAQVQGTGPGGRVLRGDLEALARSTSTDSSIGRPGGNGSRAQKPTGDDARLTPGSRLKLRGLRRTIAETMARAKRTIPHYSLIDECDATALVQLRNSLKDKCEQSSVKLTYLAFLVRAVVEALQEFPLLNASLDEEAEEIVLHNHYHIGFAAATPGGLMVPVIRDAERKGVLDIAREIERLTQEARSGRARLEDVRGATFTITSIGNLGGLISTPIIHPPEVAIMGVGKIRRRPVYDEHDRLRPADLLYLSFSFDHRVVDGDVGARFARDIIDRLETPAPLLLPFEL